MTKEPKRKRLMQTFWLDGNKPEEASLLLQIQELKALRLFSRTIRDGIRLVVSLRERRTDVLMAIFPWVADNLKNQRIEELLDQVEKLRGEIHSLRREDRADPIRRQPLEPAAPALKSVASQTPKNLTGNFLGGLNNLSALNSGNSGGKSQ